MPRKLPRPIPSAPLWPTLVLLSGLTAGGVGPFTSPRAAEAEPPKSGQPVASKDAGTEDSTPKRVPVRFLKRQLDSTFRSEGVAVADLDGDGKNDIVAGVVWYQAPDWTMRTIAGDAPVYDPKGYSHSFATFADDLNGDGHMDVIVVDFPGTPTWWYENPGPEALAAGDVVWKRHTLTPVTNNESPQYDDLTGDGRRELIAGTAPEGENPDGPSRRMSFGRRGNAPTDPFTLTHVSEPEAPGTKKYSHGLGVGDVNGDGRNDILVGEGWYEAPEGAFETSASKPTSGATKPWAFHPVDFGGSVADLVVGDFNGDGRAEVLSSSAHAFGIWHCQQTEAGTWKKTLLDDSFSQTHAIEAADLNGDGLVDFVTGKRWWAHAKGDPGGDDPAVIHWFELRRENGRARWISHQIDDDSGVGTQFQIADVDGDGQLDIVTSNKKGVFVFRGIRLTSDQDSSNKETTPTATER